MALTTTQMSLLLLLPVELRTRIIEFVFDDEAFDDCKAADEEDIDFFEPLVFGETQTSVGRNVSNDVNVPSNVRIFNPHPPVTAVSRQLRIDALPVLYRYRHIFFILRHQEGRTHVLEWLRMLPMNPSLCRVIRYVSIQYFAVNYDFTVLHLNVRKRSLRNAEQWVQSCCGKPHPFLEEVNAILLSADSGHANAEAATADLLIKIVALMLSKAEQLLRGPGSALPILQTYGQTDADLIDEVVASTYGDDENHRLPLLTCNHTIRHLRRALCGGYAIAHY